MEDARHDIEFGINRAKGSWYCPHGCGSGFLPCSSFWGSFAVWFRITVDYPKRNYVGASGLGVECNVILGAGLASLLLLCGWRGGGFLKPKTLSLPRTEEL